MNKLILFEDDEGNEYVALCTNQEYYDGLVADTKVMQEIDIEGDLTPFPTDRPLSQDF